MNINTNTLLTMLSPKLTASTKSMIENLSKNGEVEVSSLVKDASIKSLLEGLSKDLINGTKNKETIVKLLQYAKPTLELKSLSSDIKNIIQHIQSNPKLEKQINILKQFQIDIKTIDDKILKSNISNSGIFLESKLLSNSTIKHSVQNDIKAVLLQVQEQLDTKGLDTPKEIKSQVEKALQQIDFYQLSSYAAQSNKTHLPFNWDNNEDCDVEFKQNKTKDSFSCRISLSLKNHGDINVMLLLDDKNNININMNIQKDEFKTKLQDNMQIIRAGINDIGLSLQSLNIMNLKDEKNKSYEEKAYSDNIQNNFGVDIKA